MSLLSEIIHWINKVKEYITLVLQKDHVSPWSLIWHSIGVVKCYCLYDASIADYFELRLFEKRTGSEERISLLIRPEDS